MLSSFCLSLSGACTIYIMCLHYTHESVWENGRWTRNSTWESWTCLTIRMGWFVFVRRKCGDEDDYVEYSEYMPTDRRYGRLCGHQKDDSFVLQSDSSFFRLEFRSGDGPGRGGGGGFGFQVIFTFTSARINQMTGKVLRNNGDSQSQHERSSRGLFFFCVSLVITNLCGYLLLRKWYAMICIPRTKNFYQKQKTLEKLQACCIAPRYTKENFAHLFWKRRVKFVFFFITCPATFCHLFHFRMNSLFAIRRRVGKS